jgi:hypothetical protein
MILKGKLFPDERATSGVRWAGQAVVAVFDGRRSETEVGLQAPA